MTPARLQKIPGVGKTSAQVITEAVGGIRPAYLEKLEAVGPPAMSEEASTLFGRLQGDCHSHSDWSDGGSPIREMAEAAKELGHRYWALTDHSPRLTIAHGLDASRLRQQLEIVGELNAELAPFRILTGIEVDILEDGSLDQDEELLAQLDVVVASVHSKLRMEAPEMTRRMLRAIESPHTDILGHCTGRILVGRGRPQSTFDAEAVFGACARTGTAVEINSRPERLDPPEPLLALALVARLRRGGGHRRPRAGPARVAAPRLRAGGRRGRPVGSDHEHPAAGRLPRLDGRPRRLGAECRVVRPGYALAGDAPRGAPGLAHAGQADPGAARGGRPLLRAEVGRLPLHRLPGRRRRRPGQPQREAARPGTSPSWSSRCGPTCRIAACSTGRS